MTPPRSITRATAPVSPFKPNPAPTTLEQCGIMPGSSLLTSPEEQERIDAEERQRIDKGNALLDSTLHNLWACKCCRHGNAFGSQSGLCAACAVVVQQLRAEQ